MLDQEDLIAAEEVFGPSSLEAPPARALESGADYGEPSLSGPDMSLGISLELPTPESLGEARSDLDVRTGLGANLAGRERVVGAAECRQETVAHGEGVGPHQAALRPGLICVE